MNLVPIRNVFLFPALVIMIHELRTLIRIGPHDSSDLRSNFILRGV
jgi:hypothetical protein